MKDQRFTAVQQNTLQKLAQVDRPLVRVNGGFWTYADCPQSRPNVPEWWVTVQTVRALERLGTLERTNRWPEAWRDERALTVFGRSLGQEKA